MREKAEFWGGRGGLKLLVSFSLGCALMRAQVYVHILSRIYRAVQSRLVSVLQHKSARQPASRPAARHLHSIIRAWHADRAGQGRAGQARPGRAGQGRAGPRGGRIG